MFFPFPANLHFSRMIYMEQKPLSTHSLIFYISHYGSLIFDKYETNGHLYIIIDQKEALIYAFYPQQPVSIIHIYTDRN